MNTKPQGHARRIFASAAALLIGCFAVGTAAAGGTPAAGSTPAAGGDAPRPLGGIVALAFDAGSHALIKAYAGTLYRSVNDGRDWESIALPKAAQRGGITSVTSSVRNGTLFVAGRGFGVLRSSDNGQSWIEKRSGLPAGMVASIASHADQPDTVYAYVTGKGMFRSEDGGDHWKLMDAGPRDRILQFVHSNMPGSMQTGWFFAATAKGVRRSMDCFCGWRDAGAVARSISVVAYDPGQTRTIYAASSGAPASAFFVSTDGGEHWSDLPAPGKVTTALAVTPAGVLYAAVGNGELFRSADHGHSWIRIDA